MPQVGSDVNVDFREICWGREAMLSRGMRTAALDVGDARVGLAVSDESGIAVTPIGVVRRRGGQHDLDAIARALAPHEPQRLVVGLPLNMDDSEGPQAAKVRRFADRVGAHMGLPVEFWDERLTSWEAEAQLKALGVHGRRRRESVDRVAAAIILRDYLASRG